jgi:septal ring factor EnvC (AmiA/AmiB activator)
MQKVNPSCGARLLDAFSLPIAEFKLMKSCLLVLVTGGALSIGCGQTTSSSSVDAEWQKQQERVRAQMDEYDQQTKRVDAMHRKQEEQNQRVDKMLDKWEEQNRRFDAILDAMEKREGIGKE